MGKHPTSNAQHPSKTPPRKRRMKTWMLDVGRRMTKGKKLWHGLLKLHQKMTIIRRRSRTVMDA
jgi:hypothetical protein